VALRLILNWKRYECEAYGVCVLSGWSVSALWV
jgi:hypothetical protein